LASASPNKPANGVFLSQQTSTSQPKSAQKPTSEHADYYYHELEPTKVLFWPGQEVHLRFSLAISFALLLHSTSSHDTTI